MRSIFHEYLSFMLGLLIIVISTSVEASRCSDVLSSISQEITNQALYTKDFGAGIFLIKVSRTEFRIEPPPPPLVLHSAREVQKKLGDLAKKNNQDKFTVLFQGLSVGEVLAFKAMLKRDARYESDERLSSVLLETETPSNKDSNYETFREPAIHARDLLLRRYDWAKAKVNLESKITSNPPQEIYRLTVEQSKEESDSFLLRLQLKSIKFFRNRTSDIMALLTKPNLEKANVEQMAHMVISDMKKADKGVADGTLKVLAGDFIIAQAFRIGDE